MSTTAGSNDDLVGVYAMATNNTEGAVTGLREAEKDGRRRPIVGYDMSEPILAGARATARSPGSSCSTRTARAAAASTRSVALVERQEVDAQPDRPTFVFATPENVETPEVQQYIYKLDC